ncbi:hypothetical protein NEOLEDRAFT_1063065 [Neolentinus lepideus HHB14362 ss-1]|uniref:Uncharacterized protein n=1 Tax=Neolentinus lepideus HHB14362 ss-1 TaxID=1314782 RepID=A0A165TEC2_9AGAM|nr:hypothetical protein NEOLEDRAFT_1063065 [Neolentinus lepideus HHB14362 ss-1]
MYPTHRLDSPPPSSQFRRPWSPDPFDPLPSVSRNHPPLGRDDSWNTFTTQYDHHQQRREASEVSVEALDLADYAANFRRLQQYNADPTPSSPYEYGYPPFRPHDEYPPSPSPLRPLASRESFSPPSLVPANTGSTSTQTHSYSNHSNPRSPLRRPFSLPPPSRAHLSFDDYTHRMPGIYEQHDPPALPSDEIDITNFPAWSRNWYADSNSSNPFVPQMYPSLQSPQENSMSPFDPAFPTHKYHTSPYGYSDPKSSTAGHSYPFSDSSRTLLPWSNDPPDYGPPLDDEMKEERMRMLEREFGGKGIGKGDHAAGDGEDRVVGSVDEKGNLVTQGPKKRIATRWMQILFALGTGIASIYGAVVLKPNPPAPPEGKAPAYLLYVLSVITFLALLFLFVFYPCCCGGRRKSKVSAQQPFGPMGAMVLPVQHLPGGKKAKGTKGGKKGGKKGQAQEMGDVQVNLIVDPSMFMPGGMGRDAEEEEEHSEDDGSAYGSQAGKANRPRKRPKRRGVFEGLALEESWKAARKWAKKVTMFDVGMLVLWSAEFGFVMWGKRCPSGKYEGWCDSYNVATACACLLALAFCLSLFFDVKDLHTSRQSPRTRT